VDRRPVAEATFTDVSRAMVRLPFRGSTWQPGTEETGGAPRSAGVAGSGRALPCRGRWHFAADGPLAWLRDAGPVASFRLADFRMSFG
jgi:acetoacetate decarboxylase